MMNDQPELSKEERESLELMFMDHGFEDFKWVDPERIVIAQWVRMKCMFGCTNYGHKAACPPQTPSVAECQRFFKEYSSAVVFHLGIRFENPEDRFGWYKKMDLEFARLERKVFLSGFEKAFILLFGGCPLCRECKKERVLCKQPELARPSPEAMSVDVYSTVKVLGYPIAVRSNPKQSMDRYIFLMVR